MEDALQICSKEGKESPNIESLRDCDSIWTGADDVGKLISFSPEEGSVKLDSKISFVRSGKAIDDFQDFFESLSRSGSGSDKFLRAAERSQVSVQAHVDRIMKKVKNQEPPGKAPASPRKLVVNNALISSNGVDEGYEEEKERDTVDKSRYSRRVPRVEERSVGTTASDKSRAAEDVLEIHTHSSAKPYHGISSSSSSSSSACNSGKAATRLFFVHHPSTSDTTRGSKPSIIEATRLKGINGKQLSTDTSSSVCADADASAGGENESCSMTSKSSPTSPATSCTTPSTLKLKCRSFDDAVPLTHAAGRRAIRELHSYAPASGDGAGAAAGGGGGGVHNDHMSQYTSPYRHLSPTGTGTGSLEDAQQLLPRPQLRPQSRPRSSSEKNNLHSPCGAISRNVSLPVQESQPAKTVANRWDELAAFCRSGIRAPLSSGENTTAAGAAGTAVTTTTTTAATSVVTPGAGMNYEAPITAKPSQQQVRNIASTRAQTKPEEEGGEEEEKEDGSIHDQQELQPTGESKLTCTAGEYQTNNNSNGNNKTRGKGRRRSNSLDGPPMPLPPTILITERLDPITIHINDSDNNNNNNNNNNSNSHSSSSRVISSTSYHRSTLAMTHSSGHAAQLNLPPKICIDSDRVVRTTATTTSSKPCTPTRAVTTTSTAGTGTGTSDNNNASTSTNTSVSSSNSILDAGGVAGIAVASVEEGEEKEEEKGIRGEVTTDSDEDARFVGLKLTNDTGVFILEAPTMDDDNDGFKTSKKYRSMKSTSKKYGVSSSSNPSTPKSSKVSIPKSNASTPKSSASRKGNDQQTKRIQDRSSLGTTPLSKSPKHSSQLDSIHGIQVHVAESAEQPTTSSSSGSTPSNVLSWLGIAAWGAGSTGSTGSARGDSVGTRSSAGGGGGGGGDTISSNRSSSPRRVGKTSHDTSAAAAAAAAASTRGGGGEEKNKNSKMSKKKKKKTELTSNIKNKETERNGEPKAMTATLADEDRGIFEAGLREYNKTSSSATTTSTSIIRIG